MDVDRDVDGKLAQQFGCMGTSDRETLIAQFRQILNGSQLEISQDACVFFLDMNNWNLTAALGSFYDYNAQEQLNTPEMVLVDDITIGNGESVNPGAVFTKTFRVNNPGKHAWPRNCSLQRIAGSKFLHCKAEHVGIPAALPAETVEINVELVSPAEPGLYQAVWRLMTTNNVPFGQEIWCIIHVDENGLLDVTQKLAATHCSDDTMQTSIENSRTEPHTSIQNRGIFTGITQTPLIISRHQSARVDVDDAEQWRKWQETSFEEQMNGTNQSAFTECTVNANFELCKADKVEEKVAVDGFCFESTEKRSGQ